LDFIDIQLDYLAPLLIATAEEAVDDELGRPTGLKVGTGDGGQVTGIQGHVLSNL
jgi:hypothetical protein